jgi:hypothetical protein
MHQAQNDWEHIPTGLWIERYARSLEDVRSALDWGLSVTGPHTLAIRLTATSTPLWQELSLLKERRVCAQGAGLARCRARALPALENVPETGLGQRLLSRSGRHGGNHRSLRQRPRPGQAHCDDVAGQLRAVSGHLAVNLSCGNYQMALEQSQQFDRLGLNGDAYWTSAPTACGSWPCTSPGISIGRG